MKQELMQTTQQAIQQQNFAQALQTAKQLVETHPTDADARLLYGDVFREMGNRSKAIEQYTEATELRPDLALAFYKLGQVYDLEENFTAALSQFKIANRLDPANAHIKGYLGKLEYQKGLESNNINYTNSGIELMETAVEAGVADEVVSEGLAIAYLSQALATWQPHPDNPDEFLATEAGHIAYTRNKLNQAKRLTDGSNQAINNRIAELEQHLESVEKRAFSGYTYLLKAPAVVGAIALFFGAYGFGVLLLVLAGLYYVSQIRPGYLTNRAQLNPKARAPFIIRRLDALSEEIGDIWFFGSLGQIFFMKFMFRFVFGAVRYAMVIVMLPYEIIKGFVVNYQVAVQ